ncbi:MAG: DUF1573 domain-containing protein [Bacteroidetes bacterium]|jgi:hypothetical protein|nr:DUF1573 domain-containing protein [Bacteroidota bacterium]
MQKVIFSFILLVFAAFSLNAQDVQPAQAPPDPNAPEISFDKTVHDYGTIVQGADGTCEFKFTNTGKEPLILQKPVSSCGCTVPTWPQEPVLPGKSDVIKVTYATHNVGPINKTITVTSNAKTARVVLSIKGTVIAKPADKVPEKTNDNSATPIQK